MLLWLVIVVDCWYCIIVIWHCYSIYHPVILLVLYDDVVVVVIPGIRWPSTYIRPWRYDGTVMVTRCSMPSGGDIIIGRLIVVLTPIVDIVEGICWWSHWLLFVDRVDVDLIIVTFVLCSGGDCYTVTLFVGDRFLVVRWWWLSITHSDVTCLPHRGPTTPTTPLLLHTLLVIVAVLLFPIHYVVRCDFVRCWYVGYRYTHSRWASLPRWIYPILECDYVMTVIRYRYIVLCWLTPTPLLSLYYVLICLIRYIRYLVDIVIVLVMIYSWCGGIYCPTFIPVDYRRPGQYIPLTLLRSLRYIVTVMVVVIYLRLWHSVVIVVVPFITHSGDYDRYGGIPAWRW